MEEIKDILYEDFFGYAPEQPRSTWGYAELAKLHKFYDADTILDAIKSNYKAIQYAVQNKTFKNEHNMMSYVFAIIKNNIKEVYEKRQRQKDLMRPVRECEMIDSVQDDKLQQDIHADTAKDLSDILFGDDE